MLKLMRSSKFFTVFLLSAVTFMIIITFVFWGIGPLDNPTIRLVADVEGKRITYQEFWRAYDRLNDMYRQNVKDEEELKKLNLKEMALSQLIEKNVLLVIAEREGITATEDEFHETLLKEPAFQRDGAFNKDLYKRVLQLNRLTHEQYKASVVEDMMIDKIHALVTEAAELSGSEIENLNLNESQGKQIRDIILSSKKARALQVYLHGMQQTMKITINEENM